jgi:RNA polymerase sigma factor (sigma-70 family)
MDPLMQVDVDAATDVETLYVEHRGRLLGLAAAITLDRGVAEEIVHDAFAGLQRHTRHVDNPVGYLQRSVVNLSVNVVRRRQVAARHPVAPSPPASTPEIDETWASVVGLPARERAVVVLRFWQDMTIDAIADTLDWPAGSVKSTLHRALQHLKEDLR